MSLTEFVAQRPTRSSDREVSPKESVVKRLIRLDGGVSPRSLYCNDLLGRMQRSVSKRSLWSTVARSHWRVVSERAVARMVGNCLLKQSAHLGLYGRCEENATVTVLSLSLSRYLSDHSLYGGLDETKRKRCAVCLEFTSSLVIPQVPCLLTMKTGIQPASVGNTKALESENAHWGAHPKWEKSWITGKGLATGLYSGSWKNSIFAF